MKWDEPRILEEVCRTFYIKKFRPVRAADRSNLKIQYSIYNIVEYGTTVYNNRYIICVVNKTCHKYTTKYCILKRIVIQ